MSPSLLLAIGLAYVAVGAVVATVLARRGATAAAAISALACWPLLLPMLGDPPPPTDAGPLADRITRCAGDLRATMADPAADEVIVVEDLDELVADLRRADQRLGMVDRLLADVGPTAPGLDALQRARTRAAEQVQAVLDGMVELRLSIGLRSLAGNAVPVAERLGDLRARLGAVAELADLDLTEPV